MGGKSAKSSSGREDLPTEGADQAGRVVAKNNDIM